MLSSHTEMWSIAPLILNLDLTPQHFHHQWAKQQFLKLWIRLTKFTPPKDRAPITRSFIQYEDKVEESSRCKGQHTSIQIR